MNEAKKERVAQIRRKSIEKLRVGAYPKKACKITGKMERAGLIAKFDLFDVLDNETDYHDRDMAWNVLVLIMKFWYKNDSEFFGILRNFIDRKGSKYQHMDIDKFLFNIHYPD
jgi:hypothetical protein